MTPNGPSPAGMPCSECGEGTIQADGYCGDCGAAPLESPATVQPAAHSGGKAGTGTRRVVIERLIDRPTTRPVTTTRSRIGEGVVHIEPAAGPDPSEVVLKNPQVPEAHRFCSACEHPVGRSRAGKPGLTQGFCSHCSTEFDFEPQLKPGDVVANQYYVEGAMAHGGMGWIYLARDRNVSDRPCVLKGVLTLSDEAAREAAEAERRELAQLSHHQNIVSIHNYVNAGGSSGEGHGYIVMEYLSGQNLKQIRQGKDRRAPLPPHEAISYILGVLPAFSDIHRQGRVFCDFKPDNVMHVGDEVKLIDLGAVRRVDDQYSPIFGTPGYQAPEVPKTGPTVASDLYTIGRSLAVLILDWPEWQRADLEKLPNRTDHPLLVEHDCLWRFLQRACNPDPDERFADAEEMAGELRGVLHQVTAAIDGTTQPYTSTRWSSPTPTLEGFTWRNLPQPVLPDHPTKPSRIAGVAEGETAIQVAERMLADPAHADSLSWADIATVAVAHCDSDPARAARFIAQLDPDDDKAVAHRAILSAARTYLSGIIALAGDDIDEAAEHFDATYSAAPGEAGCVLAYAAVLEQQGYRAELRADLRAHEHEQTQAGGRLDPTAESLYNKAAALYDQVVMAHPSWVGAVAGLARTLKALRRQTDAAQVFLTVPKTHPRRAEALVRACEYMAGPYLEDPSPHATYDEKVAAAAVAHLQTTAPNDRPAAEAELAVALYIAALRALERGKEINMPVGNDAQGPATAGRSDVIRLSRAAEHALLELADLTGDRDRRHALLDLAAQTRPWTFW